MNDLKHKSISDVVNGAHLCVRKIFSLIDSILIHHQFIIFSSKKASEWEREWVHDRPMKTKFFAWFLYWFVCLPVKAPSRSHAYHSFTLKDTFEFIYFYGIFECFSSHFIYFSHLSARLNFLKFYFFKLFFLIAVLILRLLRLDCRYAPHWNNNKEKKKKQKRSAHRGESFECLFIIIFLLV